MAGGKVKWFDNQKGYGFIEQESGPDIFVHYSDIEGDGFRTLRDGVKVEFDLSRGDIGPKAAHVKALDSDT